MLTTVAQSAWALLDAGYDVTIIAERWTDPNNRITSQIAGALWEWPPAVCGKHTDVSNLEPLLCDKYLNDASFR